MITAIAAISKMMVFFMELISSRWGERESSPSTPEPVWESEIVLPLPREV
jgi:hypothetical protein